MKLRGTRLELIDAFRENLDDIVTTCLFLIQDYPDRVIFDAIEQKLKRVKDHTLGENSVVNIKDFKFAIVDTHASKTKRYELVVAGETFRASPTGTILPSSETLREALIAWGHRIHAEDHRNSIIARNERAYREMGSPGSSSPGLVIQLSTIEEGTVDYAEISVAHQFIPGAHITARVSNFQMSYLDGIVKGLTE